MVARKSVPYLAGLGEVRLQRVYASIFIREFDKVKVQDLSLLSVHCEDNIVMSLGDILDDLGPGDRV